MTHTKQEWRQGGGIHATTIYDHLMNKVIAYTKDSEGEANGISKKESEANAQRIVECVNGYDNLVASLNRANAGWKKTLQENKDVSEVDKRYMDKLEIKNKELTEQVEKLQSDKNVLIDAIEFAKTTIKKIQESL